MAPSKHGTEGPVQARGEVRIAAPVGEVWAALTDPARHTSWRSAARRIAGPPAGPGVVWACEFVFDGKPGRGDERCVAFEPGRRIGWTVENDTFGMQRMMAGFTNTYALEPEGPAATRVCNETRYRPVGMARLLNPMLRRKIAGVTAATLRNLKEHVEQQASQARGSAQSPTTGTA